MNENVWRQKIIGFLHDPPQKALLLGQGIGHETIAHALIEAALGDAAPDGAWEKAKVADHIASAADRIDFPSDTATCWWRSPILRHPLSGERYDLGNLSRVDINLINDWVQNKVEDVRRQSNGDLAKTFLYLWRQLADDLKQDEQPNQRLGALWDLLPADTRIPQHTIWHHNRIVSALACALPSPALLVMSIGPVQDFIACARKTRDLWVGSWILSYLSWEGMKEIASRWGPDAILFPDLRGQPLVDWWLANERGVPKVGRPDSCHLATPSLPNRWVAILPADSVEEAATAVEKSIREAWTRFSTKAQGIIAGKGIAVDPDQWKRQEGWIEVYWAAHTWPETDDGVPENLTAPLDSVLQADPDFDRVLEAFQRSGKYDVNLGTYYGRLHTLAACAHGSRKALRDFRGDRGSEPGYKCTLCGEREPMCNSTVNSCNHKELVAFWKQLGDAFSIGTVEKDGRERLCTVCLSKRLAPEFLDETFGITTHFPSTSEIAATPYKVQVLETAIENERLRHCLNEFVQVLSKANLPGGAYAPCIGRAMGKLSARITDPTWGKFAELDGEWLLPETYASDEAKELLGKAHADIFQSLIELRRETQKLNISSPAPYYAVLLLDGDQVGRWVSGTHEKLPKIESALHPDAVESCRQAFGDSVLGQKRPQSPALQGALSASLLGFSLYVARYIVEVKHSGKLVYAGGDDGLAFVPLADALPLADDLQKAFQSPTLVSDGKAYMNDDAFRRMGREGGTVHLGMGAGATTSAGIAIAHHRQPLLHVLDAVRQMEKRAKTMLGRSAFSVATLKRSGERNEAGGPWCVDKKLDAVPFLLKIVSLFCLGELSPRFLNQLRTESTGFALLPPEAWEQRITSMLKRHMSDKAKPEAQNVASGIRALIEAYGTKKSKSLDPWSETIGLLFLASFVSRHSGQVEQ